MQTTKTISQKTDVSVDADTQSDINKIADDSILDSVKRDGAKLPKDYTIAGWNIVGRVD
jgi:hypothetical protein